MSSFRLLRGGRTLLLLGILAVAGTLLWWRFARVPEVLAVAATRGTAAEIVYGTGAVEPVRWAKVASLSTDARATTSASVTRAGGASRASAWRK